MKKTSRIAIGFLCSCLLVGLVAVKLEAQTFYGKRQTGFYKTKEDGSPFGYYVPRQLSEEKRCPLIVVFGTKATDVMTWKDLADKEGLVVVSIQPKLGGIWNYSWDVDRALAKIKELKGWYPVDEKKVLAVGYEKGGVFAMVMAINQPQAVSAGAAVDAKTAHALLKADWRDASVAELDVFDYTKEITRQRPLWFLNFTASKFATPEEVKKTEELLKTNGYVVSFQQMEGEPYPPTQKMVGDIYEWFKKQTR